MLVGISPREYQVNIVNSVKAKGNTLVVLPTGLGKTLIGLMLMDECVKKGKVLFMAPTRPLAEQHFHSILKHLDINKDEVVLITGTIPPKKRKPLWDKKIIVATPQTVKNDLMSGLFTLDGFSLCIVDEAHRSIGNYAYTYVAEQCAEKNILILGLTASPGGDPERIKSIINTLRITNVEVRTKHDKDVKPYVQETKITWVKVKLEGELYEAVKILREPIRKYKQLFWEWGFHLRNFSKKNLIAIKSRIEKLNGGSKYTLISHYTTFFNLVHMLELLETQGVSPFLKYVEKLKSGTSKSAHRIVNSKEVQDVIRLVTGREHPKMEKLLEIVKERIGSGKKIIVFVQYRDRLNDIVEMFRKNGIAAEPFIGQKKGMSQEVQKKIIQDFREDKFNVLVATSIGEEGLDIPSVDSVIFYEPVPSEVRSIQRRGRAGRAKFGEVIILITAGTQDEAFYWSAIKKEKRMYSIIKDMNDKTKEDVGEKKPDIGLDGEPERPLEQKQREKYVGKKKMKREEKTDAQTNILDFM